MMWWFDSTAGQPPAFFQIASFTPHSNTTTLLVYFCLAWQCHGILKMALTKAVQEHSRNMALTDGIVTTFYGICCSDVPF